MSQHIVIEAIEPAVDGGRYPAKTVVGRPCHVEADIFRDGHDVLRAVVRWRVQGEPAFREAPLAHYDNDRWRGEFPVERIARHEFTIEAWTDVYATWLADLRKRVAVQEPIRSEVIEGVALLRHYAEGAQGAGAAALTQGAAALEAWAERQAAADQAAAAQLAAQRAAAKSRAARPAAVRPASALAGGAGMPAATAPPAPRTYPGTEALALAEAPPLLEAVAEAAPRSGASRHEPLLELIAERPRAEFGAWYELFPRSYGPAPDVHGTFRDAAKRLPALRAMGFDVVYLPPIHPIGTTFRKGRNNALRCEPGDPGSPWAIGSKDGGHMAVEPALGTLEDFRAFVAEAQRLALEVALDFAIQCSPDHPWVTEHPQWFYHRPDGTIKYAENPPKKYQDVYPLNFDCEDWRAQWEAWLEVLRFWVAQGVTIFRVDNPHTKPIAFWQWAIEAVQRDHPEAIFLAEAFTRPKMMRELAKAGFTQSYTYFTWRNNPQEMAEYLTELTQSPMRHYFRPNFFTNTPDILHEVLQTGGRPAFKMRLVLAATLAASYGIYSGFELCENDAVPGTEEYLNSEKYELKWRDWDAPDSLVGFVTRVNAIRRENAALQQFTGLRFLRCDNPNLLCYAKRDASGTNVLLMAVNMDPYKAHHGAVQVPADVVGAVADPNAYDVHDLLTGARYAWGASNYVRLDPQSEPAHILRVERRAG